VAPATGGVFYMARSHRVDTVGRMEQARSATLDDQVFLVGVRRESSRALMTNLTRFSARSSDA
jgi:hypothetical protein